MLWEVESVVVFSCGLVVGQWTCDFDFGLLDFWTLWNVASSSHSAVMWCRHTVVFIPLGNYICAFRQQQLYDVIVYYVCTVLGACTDKELKK